MFSAKLLVHTPQTLPITSLLFKDIHCCINHQSNYREINGIIHQISKRIEYGYQLYELSIGPKLAVFKREYNYRSFTDHSPIDIISTLLKEHYISYSLMISQTPPVIKQVVQYNENTLHFFNRLCSEWGLYYYFVHKNHQHTLVLTDKIEQQLTQQNPNNALKHPLCIKDLKQDLSTTTNHISFINYDSANPKKPITTQWKTGRPSACITAEKYHTHIKTYEQSLYYEKQMKRAHTHAMQQYQLQTQIPAIKLGSVIQCETHKISQLIAIKVNHLYKCGPLCQQTQKNKNEYYNHIEAVEHIKNICKKKSYHRPQIPGLLLAQNITSNDTVSSYNTGKKTLRFPWNQHINMCMRQARRQAGTNHGLQFSKRKKNLTVVEFQHGDPERGVCIGEIYHSKNKAPLKKTNLKCNGIQTQTLQNQALSLKHYLVFDDSPAHERLKLYSASTQRENTHQHVKLRSSGNIINEVSSGDKTLHIKQGHHIVTAKRIELKSGNSSVTIDNSGIHFRSPMISFNRHQKCGLPAARVQDTHSCPKFEGGITPHRGGVITEGSANVFINDQPAAREGDSLSCVGSSTTIQSGNASVQINGKAAARMNDPTTHKGVIKTGSDNVHW